MFTSHKKQETKDIINDLKSDIKFVEDKKILELINAKVIEVRRYCMTRNS